MPVPYQKKGPTDRGWQKQQITRDNVAEYFDGERMNVGVKLGRASGGLADVDLDCPEAITLAWHLLPETSAVFGRRSKPASHRLYVADLCQTEEKAALKFVEPRTLARDGAEPATLIELRIGAGDKGAQTIFPGSVHPSGERVKWASNGEPEKVDGTVLKRGVAAVAAGALLVRHYPHGGARHEAALVLGGLLARIPEMDENDIERFVGAVARVAGDEEAAERGRSAAGAVKLLKHGDPTPGLPRMRQIWGAEVSDTVAHWLGASVKGAGGDHDGRITELAKLDLLAYEQRRTAVMKEMGIRAKLLDMLVEQRRAELAEADGSGFLQPVEPWGEPVSGKALLAELTDMLKRHIVLPKHTDTAIALWTLHAHAQDAARHSPILFINSPTKRCGKTNLLEVLSRVVPKPLSAANVTPATVFRAIERWHPTMLIDETDTFLSDKSELRGVLNSGHTKSQAYVIRCVGDALVPTQFSTWCPKAFAAIGRMHPTLEDRSITIGLRRKLPKEKVVRIPKADDAYLDAHRRCARWAAPSRGIASCESDNPDRTE